MALDAVRKGVFVDLALMLIEERDMGIAEHGEAVRTQLKALGDSVQAGVDGLQWQAIDQVDV